MRYIRISPDVYFNEYYVNKNGKIVSKKNNKQQIISTTTTTETLNSYLIDEVFGMILLDENGNYLACEITSLEDDILLEDGENMITEDSLNVSLEDNNGVTTTTIPVTTTTTVNNIP